MEKIKKAFQKNVLAKIINKISPKLLSQQNAL